MQDIAAWTSVITNGIVLLFVGWAFFIRKQFDDRLDRLAKTLKDAAGVYSDIASWDKAAKEVAGMEQVLKKRHELELKAAKDEGLDAAKSIAIKGIDVMAEYQKVVLAIRMFASPELRAAVYAFHLSQGKSPDLLHVKAWEVEDTALLEATLAEMRKANAERSKG